MSVTAHTLAAGPGWDAADVVCTAGPHDRPFEERHNGASIAIVTQGTFQYRSAVGAATLVPGSLLLGNYGACFECGHEHGVGDRCLAFRYAPEHLEAIAADAPDVRRTAFAAPSLPPTPALMPLLARAEAARDDGDAPALDEIALQIAAAALSAFRGRPGASRRPSFSDERRITRALRRIEASAHESLTLAGLAREAAMSPYHFLRTFRQVAGMTPHQFVLRTRLHRAAVRLRRSDAPISAIAYELGFNDLSTFNRRFRRLMGASPSTYRARAG